MDEGFLYWLAGLIDGEGCFLIDKQPRSVQYVASFKLSLRDDDMDIILEIQEKTQIGTVRRDAPVKTSRAVAVWYIASQSDTKRLVALLDSHPLRSRKLRDYLVWREVVLEQSKSRGSRDLCKLKYLHDKIRLVRAYEEASTDSYEPEGIQLEFPMMADTEEKSNAR